ncbi:uncharacterized protein Pyn_06068 [Prunus yedoensis var. nudiflora]|uniref:Uncharacterized protein n=1 Tax=Prunus yedoensis var. nudiflora TaxID=2094558 RepID=A0A314YXP6_PRUYE|nr:uncharacterized protein Pyn_06068 [Prunus yedoensis var. nudiflora]
MALTIANSGATGGARLLYSSSTSHPYTNLSSQRHVLFPLSPRRTLHVVSAKRFTSRTGRSDGKNKRGTTTTRDQEQDPLRLERTPEIENVGGGVAVDNVDDGYFLPKLPGDEPDFWEGEKWTFLASLSSTCGLLELALRLLHVSLLLLLTMKEQLILRRLLCTKIHSSLGSFWKNRRQLTQMSSNPTQQKWLLVWNSLSLS